jgi:hypothetical protein
MNIYEYLAEDRTQWLAVVDINESSSSPSWALQPRVGLGLLKTTPPSGRKRAIFFQFLILMFWRSLSSPSIHHYLGLPRLLVPSGFPSISFFVGSSSFILSTCPATFILEILAFFLNFSVIIEVVQVVVISLPPHTILLSGAINFPQYLSFKCV